LNPKDIAKMVASTGLMTEAQPLIPQAQGTRGALSEETVVRPTGKGIPINKARGLMRRREIRILTESGEEIKKLKISSMKNR